MMLIFLPYHLRLPAQHRNFTSVLHLVGFFVHESHACTGGADKNRENVARSAASNGGGCIRRLTTNGGRQKATMMTAS